MRSPRRARPALWGLTLLLCSCRTPPPSPPPAALPAECPEPPADLSPLEEVKQLSQEAREARANLMVRMQPGDLYATLHPPELALIEAVLADPTRARQLDPAWLRQHLLQATLEIHSPEPLPALDGDLRETLLLDQAGRSFPALTLSLRSDSQGQIYRFLLDPRALRGDRDSQRIRFRVRGDKGPLQASWALSRRMLELLEDQPIVFHLSQLREVRWARWALLSGEVAEARQIIEDLLVCAPELEAAQRLQRALAAAGSAPVAAAEELALPAGPHPIAGDPGQDAGRELGLRSALLERLQGAFAAGLLPASGLGELQQLLRRAAAALAPAADEELAATLLAFDRRLAELLAVGLDVQAPLLPPARLRALRLTGASPPAAVALAELGHRLALANSGLLPHRTPAPRGGSMSRQLFDMRPLLEAKLDGERLLAKPHQRLGRGWLHPGLPPLRYQVSLRDHAGDFWAEEAARAPDLPALRRLGRRLLEQELVGPDAEAAQLAMFGLMELGSSDGRRRLLPLLDSGAAECAAGSADCPARARAAAALRALALAADQEVTAALLLAARAREVPLRVAALEGLARRGRPEDRGLLRAGLRDPDPSVSLVCLVALLRLRDGEALKLARTWLAGDPARRDALLAAAAAPPGLPWLGKDLLGSLRGSSLPPRAVAAVARSLEGAAAGPLLRLYLEQPGLRGEILGAISGPAFQPLFLRASSETEPELRRLALLRLVELKQPPREPFVQAAQASEPELRLLGQLGLARLGEGSALLALGEAVRGSCPGRALVLAPVAAALDAAGRVRLLREALADPSCPELPGQAWQLVVQQHPEEPSLLRAGLSHPSRRLRVQAALLSLGLRRGAALGRVP